MNCTKGWLCLLLALVFDAAWADRVAPSSRVGTQLNVRSEASSNSAVVGSLRQGDSARLEKTLPEWYAITLADGTQGYVSKTWSQVVPEPLVAAAPLGSASKGATLSSSSPDMSSSLSLAWIPLVTGLLAFLGVILGHYFSFILGATARRREVRRQQIERFAEFTSEDQTWLDGYRIEALFREGNFDRGPEPSERAYAIYVLYFSSELAEPMIKFTKARHTYRQALGQGYINRVQVAAANGNPLSKTGLQQAQLEAITEKHPAYYEALVELLEAASVIAEETIPESPMRRWLKRDSSS